MNVSRHVTFDRVPRIGLRKEDAARSLGLSDESFDRYVKPHIRVVRLGSLRVYPVRELARFLEARAESPLGDEHRDTQPVPRTKPLQNDTAAKGA
jgi:hypothetical protein